jgi:predicted secreted protein
MSAPSRGKIKTPDGRIVEITDQEFQYGRWWTLVSGYKSHSINWLFL